MIRIKNNPMNRRGQITIFIIIALIIIVIIAMLFLVLKTPTSEKVDEENPQAFIESCARGATEEALELLMPQGGFIEPLNYKLHQNEKINYLCYTNEYYQTCSTQTPMFVEHIEKEIKDYIEPRVVSCFKVLESRFESRYDVKTSDMNLNVDLESKQVVIDIKKGFEMTRGDNVRTFNNFRTIIVNPIYEFARLSLKISSEESKSCDFDYVNYVMLYPEIDIRKFVTGDAVRIYTLKEKKSNQEFKFALRNCILPPGF